MTARQIQQRLISDRYQRSFVLPNYTPSGWFECDVFEVTEAGYFREFEIKLTLSDFRADAVKYRREWKPEVQIQTDICKHKQLDGGDCRGPTQFWFVSPVGVLSEEIIPRWAGLLLARPGRGRYNCQIEEAKPAPRLHREKLNPNVKAHAQGVCYWRLIGKILKESP